MTAEAIQTRQAIRWSYLAQLVLGGWAGAHILFIAFLWVNHVGFPLHLEIMEGAVLQHVQRAMAFEAIYPEPSPAYVPLAYNPLYYLLAAPFAWIVGANLFTLRLVAILGMAGSGLILYRVVQEKTRSTWWGLMAAGLFAAAYRVMDTYLDNAHSDSWLLCSALLGSYILDRNRSRLWNLAGVVILISAFWFKQHGALFAIGGVLFLTWREGWRRSVPYWLTAAALGPILYLFAGPWLFGPQFHYFTWEVPRQWSELSLYTFRRYLGFIAKSYPILGAFGASVVVWTGVRKRANLNIWHVQFVFAALTGLMGSLDPGSSNNIYIPMGTWFILMGTLGLHGFTVHFPAARDHGIHLLALITTFALLVYDPRSVITSPRARESYNDLLGLLHNIEGNVYAPWQGPSLGDYSFYPAAHWVALEDMIRGPGREIHDHPTTRRLITPALNPDDTAFILANYPLENIYPFLGFLQDYYVLEADWGERFKPLRTLPKRWDLLWPRYLYRYEPKTTTR